MAGQPRPSHRVRNVLAGAYGASVGRSRKTAAQSGGQCPVGTEHLLLGLVGPVGTDPGQAGRILAAAQLTGPVVMAVLRRRGDRPETWQSDDDGRRRGGGDVDSDQLPLGELERYSLGKPMHYTGAARAALYRATAITIERQLAEIDTEHVLHGLLAVDDSRAVELLRVCGVEPARLREQLAGSGPVTAADDPVAPELRPTRDALLGYTRYRSGGWLGRLGAAMFRLFPLAEVPGAWVRLEAPEQARRLGPRRVGTEHLVLAILAVHETLRHYPHLQPDDAADRYAGGRVLAEAAVTYRDARDLVRRHPERLGIDPRPARSYARGRTALSAGTGQLLLAVLTQDDSRGASLLRLLGLAPAQLRARLRARRPGR